MRALAASSLLLLLAAAPAAAPASAQTAGSPIRSEVAATPEPRPDVRLLGRGFGHGVGMSQYGAYAQSRAGWSHSQILQHYYPGTTIDVVDDRQQVDVRLFWAWNGQGAAGTDQNRRTSLPATASGAAVPWLICPLTAGVACRTVSQPAGTTWTVQPGEGRVLLLDRPDGVPVFAGDRDGYRSLAAQLTAPRDELPPAERPTRRVETGNPNPTGGTDCTGAGRSGVACYGFGHLEFAASADGQLLLTNRLPLGAYLRGLAEMPSSWGGSGGQAALETQAVAARTYAVSRNRTVRATTNDQVFRGLTQELNATHHHWVAAVMNPVGAILRAPGGAAALTFYSSSNGGRTENLVDSVSYGTIPFPYLVSRDDPWSRDPVNPCRAWERRATHAEVASYLSQPIPQTLQRVERVQVLSRTEGGTPRELGIRGVDTTGATRDFVFTRPGSSGKNIAGGHLRAGLPVAAARGTWSAADACSKTSRTPSSQITSIGFAPFTDDDGGTHEYATVWAHQAGVAEGTTPTTFAPAAAVTRAQMASFINRTFAVAPSAVHPFSDVPRDSTHAAAINALAAAGIARGSTPTTFDPGASVTRAQMASFLARAAGWDVSATSGRFVDVRANGSHVGAIVAVDREGVTTGCASDRFCPAAPVSRGQMASFLYRLVRS